MMNKSFQEPNLTMLTDFYELTMANGYFANGFQDTICYFDMFFRKVPDNGGVAIMAGVEQLVAVSYTHLDVYKRQPWTFFSLSKIWQAISPVWAECSRLQPKLWAVVWAQARALSRR